MGEQGCAYSETQSWGRKKNA